MSARVLLIGNGSNHNRGCEAIARGTLTILRAAFGAEVEVRNGILADPDVVTAQGVRRDDDEPVPFRLEYEFPRGLVSRLASRLLNRRVSTLFPSIDDELEWADVVLEVGGDNYSFDYAVPYLFIDLDRKIQRAGKPLAIFGASVGPFSSDPLFEAEIMAHIRKLNGVFVRESISFDYLRMHGVARSTKMGDPAIMMESAPIPGGVLDSSAITGAIGFNFSPFQAGHFTPPGTPFWALEQAHLDRLAELAAKIVTWATNATDRPILLVPHVFAPVAWNNDHQLLLEVMERLDSKARANVICLPDSLTAPQIKWAISKCSVFAGSRTHSTLAAISCGVPTLAFGYSRKAKGLMGDLYGGEEFCLPADQFTFEGVTSMLRELLVRRVELGERIARVLPNQKETALAAGRMIADFVLPKMVGRGTGNSELF
jgi:colanic acid/amylovoran biosynthesis protein